MFNFCDVVLPYVVFLGFCSVFIQKSGEILPAKTEINIGFEFSFFFAMNQAKKY